MYFKHYILLLVIVESKQANVISELREQQQNETTSTLLLIDAESCTFKYPDECPDLLLTVVRSLKQGLIHNVVPISKYTIHYIRFEI